LGVCREHADKVSTTFETMEDVEELVRAIDDGRVHLASEVSSHHSHVITYSHRIFSDRLLLLPLVFSQIISLVTRPLVTRGNKFPWIVANPSSEIGTIQGTSVSDRHVRVW
jgi:hypothetical protein